MENQVNNETPLWSPVCDVCKKRDETLRAVSYPYVVSVLVMSFRRAFSGVYCRKHQRWYHFLASLITSTVGWLGIPYGFIMTPMTLFSLARGGITNTEVNIQLLTSVADKKISEGDSMGAVRCLEECLKLKEDPEIRSRLAKLYQIHRASTQTHDSETLWQIVGVPLLIMTSTIVGLLIGLLDLLLAFLLSPFFPKDGSIFIVILSWLPIVTMLFLGILTIRATLRWTLNKNERIPILLGILLAFTSTFFAFYSVLEGQAVIRNLRGFFAFFAGSSKDGIFAVRSVLSHGGVDVLINNFRQGEASSVIFTVLLIAGIGLSLYMNVEMVIQVTNGQRRIAQVRDSLSMVTENPALFAWGMFGFMLLGLILFLTVSFPGKYVNTEDAYQKINLGMTELNQYHPDKAVIHFKEFVQSWPDSVLGHVYLGLGYTYQEKYDDGLKEVETSLRLDTGSTIAHLSRAFIFSGQSKFEEAISEQKVVVQAQPSWGLPHAYLAILHFELDQLEEAEREIQQAILYGKEDAQTLSLTGMYYYGGRDFEQAESYTLRAIKLANSASDYLYLTRIYVVQGKVTEAQKTIDAAEKMGADPVDVYLAKINLAEYREDMDAASALVIEALKLQPSKSDLFSEKSFIEYQQGHIDMAMADAEKAVELNPYNPYAFVDLAYAYHAGGKLAEATKAAEKAVASSPKYDRGHYILGLCYMDKGMKDEAVKEFEIFLKLYWDRPIAQEEKQKAELYMEQLR